MNNKIMIERFEQKYIRTNGSKKKLLQKDFNKKTQKCRSDEHFISFNYQTIAIYK